jgi:DNA helicase HerA-like ATPase
MLAEIRAFGQGIMIVEQIPTKIISEAIKNTNLKVMLRLTSKEDREYLGEAMNFTEVQKRFVTNLKTSTEGINFVVFEEGIEQPLLLSLPFEPVRDPADRTPNWLYDPFFPAGVNADV